MKMMKIKEMIYPAAFGFLSAFAIVMYVDGQDSWFIAAAGAFVTLAASLNR